MAFFSRLDLQEGLRTFSVLQWIPVYFILGILFVWVLAFFWFLILQKIGHSLGCQTVQLCHLLTTRSYAWKTAAFYATLSESDSPLYHRYSTYFLTLVAVLQTNKSHIFPLLDILQPFEGDKINTIKQFLIYTFFPASSCLDTAGAIPILGIPYFLLFTSFWPLSVLSLTWLLYDWNTHSRDGRRSAWVRNWTLWKYFQSYFPVKLVKTHDLSPKHNYIIVSHPHGVLSFGAFINFATEATGFSRIFPSITPFLATLEGIFWIPIVREYVMSMGICPVSELALKHKLTQKGSGNAVIIVVGGASEALLCRPGVSTVYLKNHKGFVKLALKTGAYLVPSYAFGENEVFNQETFPEGTWLRFFQKNFQKIGKKILGINFCTFHGRGLTRGSWGFLPFNHPITNVVGEPMPVPQIHDPDKETVAKYLELYISALRKLFDQHKAKYGFSETQELTVI